MPTVHTACAARRLARFWLRWQVRKPLHLAFVAWRAVAKWRRRGEQQAALAQGFGRLLLLRRGVPGLLFLLLYYLSSFSGTVL